MMKILHSADWHLGAPIRGYSPEQTRLLRREMSAIPQRLARLCRDRQCDLILLSGDLFDGPCSRDTQQAVAAALEEAAVPVFIAPGNHDHIWEKSPYYTEVWPENVHIFKHSAMESVVLEELDCRVYGGAFTMPEAQGMLEGFQAEGSERYAVAVLHGDPGSVSSPYCPVTAAQVRESGLDYLALGHIHAAGSFRAGATLAAWPGCAMGHGFDETGEKGALVVTLDQQAEAEFVPLHGIRFYDVESGPGEDPASKLPAMESRDFIRLTLTGHREPPDLERLRRELSRFPNLILRDRSRPMVDIWADAGQDSLQGTFFGILREASRNQDAETVRTLELAAKIARQILLGQEVELP